MDINLYLSIIRKRYESGISREHSYRGDFENLFRALVSGVEVTNEPANVTDCGNPDYVIMRGKIPVGYIEAKDIGKDLNSKTYTEQFSRYKKALDNLIITDYLWFQFFQHEQLVYEIRIADIADGKIKPLPDNFELFKTLVRDFSEFKGQTIKSPQKLAEMMANKAQFFQSTLAKALQADVDNDTKSALRGQYDGFKEVLIHDLTPISFADIYAQTLAYGMFAARLHDTTLEDFSRQEAAELIPKSNPFLRKLFGYIAGPDIDDRIKTTVDNLADVFRATNVEQLLKGFGANTRQEDPIIHFYETFLAAYDPKLRKSRGVWYTPEPVVKFIVRAVDDLLKAEFGLPEGLADTSKTEIKVDVQGKEVKKEVHKVQILDPATGTGTFLAEVIKLVHSEFEGQQGIWNSYAERHLLPRLNGFELLMASYAMAHLKLELLLMETGYVPKNNQRLKVYLTNSLEAASEEMPDLFMSQWLTEEAVLADSVKRNTPVMCVIGNPPYSGESANKGSWIMRLMEDYKTEPGGKEKLKERNPKWINDDYVKFIRYGQHYVERNGSGILAYINPHGFLDNPTFRGMRWHLLKTFDIIYTIDLHGNAKKKETAPDGGTDMNVFDIQQGVSINLFVKTGKKKVSELGKVMHFDLYGDRESKYKFLYESTIDNIAFKEVSAVAPNFFFVPKDFELLKTYEQGIYVNELFSVNNVGIVTSRDHLVIDECKDALEHRIKSFFNLSKDELIREYKINENSRWNIDETKKSAKIFHYKCIQKISYRPFDIRFIYYHESFLERNRKEVMQHFLKGENVGLVTARQCVGDWQYVFITTNINEFNLTGTAGRFGSGNTFPLYLYPDEKNQDLFAEGQERTPNLTPEIVNQIAKKLELTFTNEKEATENTFAPIDLLDYIYAVLHSPTYREKYKEFLKIDFPRVPYPKNQESFWQLAELGGELRTIHLLENPKVTKFITQFNVEAESGKTIIFNPYYKDGKVYINDNQYFDHVPEVAWNMYIGGYQPAQKWLKDRKNSILFDGGEPGQLDFEDIIHYQKIIVALTETDRLMQKINEIEVE
jgi:predicted helicase